MLVSDEKDFDAIHRAPKAGGAERESSVEVWTRRCFAANEIILAPCTSEIKDRYWTYSKAVMVNLPRSTSRALGGKTLALDGRLRANFVEARQQNLGCPQQDAQFGSLFFAIERTTEKDQANLFLQYATMPLTSSVTLPNGKKNKISVPSSSLP